MKTLKTTYKTIEVDGVNIFYREAGNANKPNVLLLGGFPSTSHNFKNLINELKEDYHVIAPDYEGFGNSDAPDANSYNYTFDQLANTLEKFIDLIGLNKFTLYAFDYGGPVGFRLAAKRPELIEALIVQNATAYAEGIGAGFESAMPFLQNRNEETEKPIRQLFTLEGVKMFYHAGAENPERISTDNYLSDFNFLNRPGMDAIHLNLLHNYSSNLAEFATWQQYFRSHQPSTLLVWGKNDPFFPEAAARAFLNDLPTATLKLYNTGHFALEEYGDQIANDVKDFLAQVYSK